METSKNIQNKFAQSKIYLGQNKFRIKYNIYNIYNIYNEL